MLLIGGVGLSYDDGRRRQLDLMGTEATQFGFPDLLFHLCLLRGNSRKDAGS